MTEEAADLRRCNRPLEAEAARLRAALDGSHVSVQDITHRKRVEAALLSEVARRPRGRDRLWETTDDVTGTAGLDGVLTSVDPA